MNLTLHSIAVWLRAQYNEGGIDAAIEAAAKQIIHLQEEIEQLKKGTKNGYEEETEEARA
jgi:hypothetical protein